MPVCLHREGGGEGRSREGVAKGEREREVRELPGWGSGGARVGGGGQHLKWRGVYLMYLWGREGVEERGMREEGGTEERGDVVRGGGGEGGDEEEGESVGGKR